VWFDIIAEALPDTSKSDQEASISCHHRRRRFRWILLSVRATGLCSNLFTFTCAPTASQSSGKQFSFRPSPKGLARRLFVVLLQCSHV